MQGIFREGSALRVCLVATALAACLVGGAAPAGAAGLTVPVVPPAAGSSVTAPAPKLLTLEGQLVWETALEGPHAELVTDAGERYALAPAPGAALDLQALAGRRAVVTGYPAGGPSILQMPVLVVTALKTTAGPAAPPVTAPPVTAPPVTAPPVTAPPVTAPRSVTPPADRPVRILPVPYHGTALSLLFGTVAGAPGAGTGLWRVDAAAVWDPAGGLGAYLGQRVAVVARPVAGLWQAVQVWPLQQDWAPLLKTGAAASLYAEPDTPIRVAVAGRLLSLDAPPLVGNQRTLVPLRAIAEALGAEVAWEATTQTVTVRAGDRRVAMQVGSTRLTVYLEGRNPFSQALELDIAPVIVRSRVLLPVRALSEALGWQVEYDAGARLVRVSK